MTRYLGHTFTENTAWRAKRKLINPVNNTDRLHNYRFIGLQFFLKGESQFVKRKMYGLTEMGGELGGLLTIMKIVFGALVMWGGQAKLFNKITNKLYKEEKLSTSDKAHLAENPNKFWRDRIFKKRNLHELHEDKKLEISLPKHWVW